MTDPVNIEDAKALKRMGLPLKPNSGATPSEREVALAMAAKLRAAL